MSTLQLERQAVSHKAILDFTIQRLPELPPSVTQRFPELRKAGEDMERMRINLQLQLREQFVAIRNMLDQVATIKGVDTVKTEIVSQIDRIKNQITIISQIDQDGPGMATIDQFGIVKVDKTVEAPVVYLNTTVDELIAALKKTVDASIATINHSLSQIFVELNQIEAGGQYIHTQLAAAATWTINHGRDTRPGGVRAFDTSFQEFQMVNQFDDVIGTTRLEWGYSASGTAILVFT